MEPVIISILQSQIQLQCRFILLSAEHLRDSIERRDSLSIFYDIHNMLNAAANVSKALFSKKTERLALRESLGVATSSPFYSRDMRNNFEHYDNEVEIWWKNSKHKHFIDMIIGADAVGPGVPDSDQFRTYDPDTGIVIFLGERFDLGEIVNEADKLLATLEDINI